MTMLSLLFNVTSVLPMTVVVLGIARMVMTHVGEDGDGDADDDHASYADARDIDDGTDVYVEYGNDCYDHRCCIVAPVAAYSYADIGDDDAAGDDVVDDDTGGIAGGGTCTCHVYGGDDVGMGDDHDDA